MTRYYSLFCVIFFYIFSNCYSQGVKKNDSILVKILPRVQKDKVLLRWAVNDPLTWQKTNKSGFVLEKYLLVKSKENSLKKLWSKKMIVDPLETWQDIVEKDDNAAIIAQSIFGESFTVEGGQGALAKIKNVLNEREQRFSFGLLAADMSFNAAVKAGWGYVDTDVKANEKYVYKIKVAPYKTPIICKSSAVVVALKDYEVLPYPLGFTAIFGDKTVMLTWDYDMFKGIYTSYNLEKSEDGITFTPLSDKPLVNMNNKPNAPSKSMFYMDSLASNAKKYYYRVNGVSIFQEKGKYSKVVSGKGSPKLSFTPLINNHQFTQNENEMLLYWEYPKEGEKSTKKFQLKRAPTATGKYKIVVDSIPVTDRKLKYSGLASSNYFKISAIGKSRKQERTSYAVLVQPTDSIPPSAPIELKGVIDTLGIAKISWKANTEPDIRGYRVFRGFLKGEELSQVTVSPIKENTFIDTIAVRNLNSKVFYEIVAVDMRHNNSEKSEVFVLDKPDLVPPSSPVFENYKVTDKGVLLAWIKSSEEGVEHVLMRKNKTKNTDWKVIYNTKDKVRFVDKNVENKVTYKYRIKAIDKAGLESQPTTALTITAAVSFKEKKGVRGFSAFVNRPQKSIDLSWRKSNDVSEYKIYKQLPNEQPITWRILKGDFKKVVDKDISPNESYIYHIKAVLKNGVHSKVEIINVKY